MAAATERLSGKGGQAKPDMLIISPTYANFVKDPAEAMSPGFGKMSVIVTHNPIADLSDHLPLDSLKLFAWNAKVDVAGKPDNVEVVPARTLYLPTDRAYRKLPGYSYRAVEKALEKRRIDFDISHSHFISPQGYVGVRLKEKYGVPAVITAHGYDIYELPYRSDAWREMIASTLNAADHIITVSNSNLQHIKKLKIKTPVSVIPNGFREDLFYPEDRALCRKILGIPAGRKVILTVGMLIEVKGHEHLIRAVRKIADVDGDVLCIIVGQGGLRGRLQRLIGRLKLEGKVVLAGPKPHDELRRWINAADVFVLPSLNEGNPTVMFECLGCGRPFVGTRVGGIPEHVAGDEIGYLVEPGSPEQLAEAIRAALGRTWDQGRICQYAGRYTWNALAKEYLGVYGRYLRGREPAWQMQAGAPGRARQRSRADG